MVFKPETEKDIAERKLFPAGTYDFEITGAVEKPSKRKGRPMIELTIRISDGKGGSRTIYDYLLKEMPLKLRHASEACGLLDRYNTGSLPAALFLDKRGRVVVAIEKGKGEYRDRNVISDYLRSSTALTVRSDSRGANGMRLLNAGKR